MIRWLSITQRIAHPTVFLFTILEVFMRVSVRKPKSFFKNRINPRTKATEFIKETAKSPKATINNIKRGVESAKELREAISQQDLPGVLAVTTKLAKARKSPIGANGINLQPTEMRTVTLMSDSTAGFTNSACMYMYRPPRKNVDDAVKYCMKRTVETATSSDVNLQNVADFHLLDAKPVKDNPGNANDYSVMTVQTAFQKYLKASVTAGTSSYVAKLAQANIHIKSLTSEMTIKNLATDGVMIDLYDLVPAHNIGPSTYDGNQAFANGYMSPGWAMSQGLSDTNVIEPGNDMTPSTLGAKPTNSTLFTRTWKQVKHTRINMSANATHRHRAVYAINKTVSYPEFDQFSPDGGMFAGWNPVTFMIIRGVPTSNYLAAATSIKVVNNLQLNYEATPDRQAKVIVFNSNT